MIALTMSGASRVSRRRDPTSRRGGDLYDVGVRASFETDDLFFPLFHHPLADMPANLEEFPFAQTRSLTLPPAKEGDGIMKIEPKPSDWEVLAGLVERVTASWLPSLATRQSLRPVEWITASGEWVNERTHGQQFEAWFLRRATMAARRGGGGPAFPGADALQAARARGGCGGQIESTAVVTRSHSPLWHSRCWRAPTRPRLCAVTGGSPAHVTTSADDPFSS
jgi:hypothetical protein